MTICDIKYENNMQINVHGNLLCIAPVIADMKNHIILSSIRKEGDKLYEYDICYTCFAKTTKPCKSKIDGRWAYGCQTYQEFWFNSTKQSIKKIKYETITISVDGVKKYIIPLDNIGEWEDKIQENRKRLRGTDTTAKWLQTIVMVDIYLTFEHNREEAWRYVSRYVGGNTRY